MEAAEEVKESRAGGSTVSLVAMGGESFTVDRAVIAPCNLIRVTIENDGDAAEVPLPTVRGAVLAKVVAFCTHHHEDPMHEIPKPIKHGRGLADHVQPWYADFVAGLDTELVCELMLAANYLDVKPLLDLMGAVLGLLTKNKTPDEIRAVLGITQPFAPEVDKQLREEIRWSTEPPVRPTTAGAPPLPTAPQLANQGAPPANP